MTLQVEYDLRRAQNRAGFREWLFGVPNQEPAPKRVSKPLQRAVNDVNANSNLK